MTTTTPMVWIAFNIAIVLLLLLDAFVLNPKGREMSMRRALALTAFWFSLALLFNLGIYVWLGDQKALEFLTAFLVEQSLSIDNLFLFMLIFTHFKVNPQDQHRILFVGIVSAQIMRAVFILAGVALLNQFHWMIYIFGGILIITGFKLFYKKEDDLHIEDNFILKMIGNRIPRFFVVLLMIETTDLIFAIDSVPAVLAITKDPFIAYTSNIFAILGLRSMYFALTGFLKVFHHLHYGLAVILIFIGFKMLTESFWHVPVYVTLGVIILTLTATAISSSLWPPKSAEQQ
jgi:tellurite resistance protein TerC